VWREHCRRQAACTETLHWLAAFQQLGITLQQWANLGEEGVGVALGGLVLEEEGLRDCWRGAWQGLAAS